MPNVLSNLKLSHEPDLEERILLHHAVVHGTSYLCIKSLQRDYPLRVVHGMLGWCLGAVDELGLLLARDSQYFRSEEEAQAALEGRCWTQRMEL